MEYLNNAQQLEDEFNSLFPVEVNHTGGKYSCENFAELEEWANFLDDKGFSADFDLNELERRGDDLILEMYVKQNLESYINGNISYAIDNFNTMFEECLFNDVIAFLEAEELPENTNEIIRKLLEGKY